MAELIVETKHPSKTRKGLYIVAGIFVVVVLAWLLIRPGVFVVQPIGAIPEGVTILYYARGSEVPFFSSPDGLCLQIQGEVSLMCRMTTLTAAVEITDRAIVRLPYSHWAYLRSTGGLEFDR
ncbi:MAG: hypothetical protein JXR84_08520 [Anaerolineae bacterium]|nr:hypothetical protein [Anaerolineae bacterium]